ncbi:MAG: short chain dehydrogenase [Rhodobacteraceae bacterium]|nr:MAG: short chain dehydrogenase [Paracoccaceae bacterium]
MRLKGKTAIITGGASGFGAGIASSFSKEGAKVIIADINMQNADKIAKKLDGFSIRVDVSNKASVKTAIAETLGKVEKIDILVNNAGITHLPSPMEQVSEEEFDNILAVNTKSVFLTSHYLIPHFKENKSGVILNIASTAGVSPRANLTWYNASKGWMITATKSMAIELAPLGIRANAINPVAGETPLLKSFMGEDTPAMRKKFLATIPIGRFSTPTDIGATATFLCSNEASMITGVALEVDGGRCI